MIVIGENRPFIGVLQPEVPKLWRKNLKVLNLSRISDNTQYYPLSAYYPHGNIPVPGYPQLKAQSVWGAFQALEVHQSQRYEYHRWDPKEGLDFRLLDLTDSRKRVLKLSYISLGWWDNETQSLLSQSEALSKLLLPLLRASWNNSQELLSAVFADLLDLKKPILLTDFMGDQRFPLPFLLERALTEEFYLYCETLTQEQVIPINKRGRKRGSQDQNGEARAALA